jgi:hypothetical protein
MKPLFILICIAITSISTFFAQEDLANDTYYYEFSSIRFGKEMKETNLIGEAETFNLTNGEVEVLLLLEMDKALLCTEIFVEIYDASSATSEQIENFSINSIDPTWDYVFFKVKLKKEGTFYIDLYNQNDVFINSATVVINK